MRARRKITTPAKKEDKGTGFVKAFDFIATCKKFRDAQDYGSLGAYLMQQYTVVFNQNIPSVMLCLIEAKIGYRLLFLEGGLKTPKTLQNYHASQKMELEGFDADSKFYMEQSIIKEQKEKSMGVMKRLAMEGKKEKTGNKEKGAKLKVKELFVPAKEVLVSLFKAHPGLSDEKILAKLIETTGKKFKLAKVKRHRARFNSKSKGKK